MSVGSRVSVNGHLATIRFVGEVASTVGTWLGVEWDDPHRGKHDGVKDGVKYFECSWVRSLCFKRVSESEASAPNSGSFIRPSAAVSFGKSFLDALASKYVDVSVVPNRAMPEKVKLGSTNIEVEAVGLDKVRAKLANLSQLREVSLDKEEVAFSNDSGQIRSTCPKVKGLDLSSNLIASWDTLALIISELPLLNTLSFNHNRLHPLRSPLRHPPFTALRDLRLNETFITWGQFLFLVPLVPQLENLQLGYNMLVTLGCSNPHFTPEKLQVLNLDGNKLNSWIDIVSALAGLSSLARLVLTANHIDSIPVSDPQAASLQNIQHLSIVNNRINSWSDIDALATWFPRLESLSISDNPVVNDPTNRTHAWQFLVTKIPSLTFLNGSTISLQQRRDCELFYLSFVSKQHYATPEGRLVDHPRWTKLCETYGEPDEAKEVAANVLGNRLISIRVHALSKLPSQSSSAPASPPRLELRLLKSMTIRALRIKVLKSLKLPVTRQARMWLFFSGQRGAGALELDEQHDLEYWGVEEDAELGVFVEY